MTSSDVHIRRPGDAVPDLTTYRVVHRAMTTDLDRLATAATELVDRHDGARLAALRYYLRAVSHEIESHHRVEDEDLWPFLEAVAADRTVLVPLTEDHNRLDPLLHRANELAAGDRAVPELASVLREITDLLVRHIAAEERDVFPIILDRVGVADYARLQERFRGNLRPAMLPFLAPWAVRHATDAERAVMLAEAGWPLRVLYRVFAPRFRAREDVLFGGLSRKDVRLVRLMRRVSRVHAAVLRGTGGRIGGKWSGGSDVVLLTVVGRRTGNPHTVTLMTLTDGQDLLVAASQGGVDREPQWWLNLLANPHAEVEFRGERYPVTAEKVGDDERPAIWAQFVAATTNFVAYQEAVRRQIALVRLRRIS